VSNRQFGVELGARLVPSSPPFHRGHHTWDGRFYADGQDSNALLNRNR